MGCSCSEPPPLNARTASAMRFCCASMAPSSMSGVIAATGAGMANFQVPFTVQLSLGTRGALGQVLVFPLPSVQVCWYVVTSFENGVNESESRQLTMSLPVMGETAAWLLAPYWLWVTYAAALNFAVWKMNA